MTRANVAGALALVTLAASAWPAPAPAQDGAAPEVAPPPAPEPPAADPSVGVDPASSTTAPRSGANARAQARAKARAASRAQYRRRLEAYRRTRDRWHRAAPPGVVRRWQREMPPPMVLRPVQHPGEYVLLPEGDAGGFDAEDLEAARKAFTYRDGTSCDIHPRLVELMYRAVRQFNAPYVHVVSGYRSTARATSRHHQGRAVDFVLPGVSNGRLARFLRSQGFVGVGTYPVSGFVHLDVRERSYFWNDAAGPGRRSRSRTTFSAEVYRHDSRARSRGEEAVPELVLTGPDGGLLDGGELGAESSELP